jgi:hypothetical protein
VNESSRALFFVRAWRRRGRSGLFVAFRVPPDQTSPRRAWVLTGVTSAAAFLVSPQVLVLVRPTICGVVVPTSLAQQFVLRRV